MFYRILDNKLYDYAEYEYSDKCLETNIITQQEFDDKKQAILNSHNQKSV